MSTEALRHAIIEAGGLHTVADLARRWSISRERVRQLSKRDDFPVPVLHVSGHAVYDGNTADRWWLSRS